MIYESVLFNWKRIRLRLKGCCLKIFCLFRDSRELICESWTKNLHINGDLQWLKIFLVISFIFAKNQPKNLLPRWSNFTYLDQWEIEFVCFSHNVGSISVNAILALVSHWINCIVYHMTNHSRFVGFLSKCFCDSGWVIQFVGSRIPDIR